MALCRITGFSLSMLLFVAIPARGGWQEGKEAFLANRLEEAAREFEAVSRAHPDHAAAFYMLGKTQQRQGKSSEALQSLRRATELDPGSASFALALGEVYLDESEPRKALLSLAKHPLNGLPEGVESAYLATFVTAAMKAEGTPESEGALEAAVAQKPGAKTLWLTLAKTRERSGDTASALDAYGKALEIDGGDEALGRKAVQLAWDLAAETQGEDRQEAYRRAADLALRAAAAGPSTAQRLVAGEALLLAGDPAAAARWLTPASRGEGRAAANYLLARCALGEGDGRKALGHLEKALEALPDADLQSRVHRTRGRAQHLLKDYSAAAASYRASGDPAKAAEMDRFAKIARENAEIERKREECLAEKAKIESLRSEQEGLEGTDVWQRMERVFAEKLAACEPYLNQES